MNKMRNKQIDNIIKNLMTEHKVDGLGLAIVDDYKIIKTTTYGYVNGSNIKMTNRTLFQVASISKTAFAVAVVNMFQQDKLDIYSNIENYFNGYKIPGNKDKHITFENLLMHRAGINVGGFDGYDEPQKLVTQDIVEGKGNSEMLKVTLPPNEQHKYSGGGYTIAELAVENIFETLSYEQILKKYLFKPIKAKRYGFDNGLRHPQNIASKNYNYYYEYAAAGLYANAETIAQIGLAVQKSLNNQGFLTPENAKLLTSYQGFPHAIGYRVNKRNTSFWHGGINNDKFKSHCCFSKNGNGIVVLTNGASDEIFIEIEQQIKDLLNWKEFDICDFRYNLFPS